MTPRPRRWVAAALAGLAASALVAPARTPAAAPPAETSLTATDVSLLNGVRLAGLWEIPAGQMAAEKGDRQRVREIGTEIAKQHVELDLLVVEAANRLGARIPDQPNASQKQWLGEMQNASGTRFDRIFVERLRAAHGRIFPVIAAVRAGTRNETIRKLATAANTFVGNHLIMLESTGLVRYVDLPPPAVPPQQVEALRASARRGHGVHPAVVWIALLAVLALAGAATVSIVRRPLRAAAARPRDRRPPPER